MCLPSVFMFAASTAAVMQVSKKITIFIVKGSQTSALPFNFVQNLRIYEHCTWQACINILQADMSWKIAKVME